MTYTPDSPLTKTSGHVTAQQLYAAFEPITLPNQRELVRRALDRIVVLSKALNLDEIVAGAIAWVETGEAGTGLPFRSRWWIERLNLGNLGVTGDPKQNEASQSWSAPEDAANGLMAHLTAYAYGADWPFAWDVDALGKPQTWDQRFQLVLAAYGGAALNSLDALNGRWAVDRDNDYGGKLAERANALVAAIDPPVTIPDGEDPEEIPGTGDPPMNVYRRVPHPPFIDLPVSKPSGGGYGYTQIPTGSRHIVGVMNHETQGRGSGPWYREFFSCPSGQRCADALVDYEIARDGTIYRFNDPGNNRSPWANGGPLGLEGDGPAFYARFGASGVNNSLISIEHESLDDENWTDAQVHWSGLLNAYWHDQDGQDWESYPYAPKYNCVTSLAHFEIGTTNCGKGELDDISRVQAVAKGEMKRWQTQADGPSVPEEPDVPGQPDTPELPGGITLAEAVARFGTLTRHTPDGKTRVMPFDARGPISLAWAHRCAETGEYPAAEDWYALSDSGKTLDLITFSNDWRLMRVAERQALMWVDLVDAEMEEAA